MSTTERAEVFVASPGRNFVTLRITTSDGWDEVTTRSADALARAPAVRQDR